MSGKIIVYVLFLTLMSSLAIAYPAWLPENTQVSYDGDAVMRMNFERPQIMSSVGDSDLFTYEYVKDGDGWLITVCPTDYEKNYELASKEQQTRLETMPITVIKGDSRDVPTTLNLSVDNCETFKFLAADGDSVKIGRDSTTINISNGTAEFSVMPEEVTCHYDDCQSSVIINNLDTENVSFPSADITIQFPMGTFDIYQDGLSTSQNYTINIVPNSSVEFTISGIAPIDFTHIKYNVSFDYLNTNYLIDPIFLFSNATAESMSSTALDNNTAVYLWCNDVDNTIEYSIVYMNGTFIVNTTTIAQVEDCAPEGTQVSVSAFNSSLWTLGFFNGTGVNTQTRDRNGNAITSILNIDDDAGNGQSVSVSTMNDTDYMFFWVDDGAANERVRYQHRTYDGTIRFGNITVSDNDIQNARDAAVSCANSTTCIFVWRDAGQQDVTAQVVHNGVVTMNDFDIDTTAGVVQEVDVDFANNSLFAIAWVQQTDAVLQTFTFNESNISGIVIVDTVGVAGGQNIEIDWVNNSALVYAFTDSSPTSQNAIMFDRFGNNITPRVTGVTLPAAGALDVVSEHRGFGICDDNLAFSGVGAAGIGARTNKSANFSAWDGTCIADIIVPPPPPPAENLAEGTFFDCFGDAQPVFEPIFEWYCLFNTSTTMNAWNCVSQITQGTELIQNNPHRKNIKEFGSIDSYEEKNGVVNIQFTDEKLRRGQTYNFSVTCHSTLNNTLSETVNLEVTPSTETLWIVGDRAIWLKQNMFYALGALLMLVLALMGARWWWNSWKSAAQ